MKKILYIITFFLSLGVSGQETLEQILSKYNQGSIPYISSEQLLKKIQNSSVLILDTREKEEYNVSKIKGAVFVGYNQFSIKQFSNFMTNKNQHIVVYCSLGIRSEKIGEKLKKAGYANVKNLYGGIFEWKNQGNPVLDAQENETDNVHAYSPTWSKWLTKGNKVY
ncbi:MAG: rhodanese-like domain-containing protein [Flavobacteriaceae bacterium CG_4_8_14_3_um_filter_34_10]|nr:rhodanese-like domain-containing protein [Flavobacteriia bacterium]OIP51120.1 MAG: rhodanese [Flavobacteriaceae bacterium CG2_30_34_30]PIQ16948.1 MAG: rhodanese [Flavobacteriaceae bacterium CG18_big_fil_WC_8_21_14_2_50_34_36]PIV51647.1 MAG: rhodanese-like domain-containing protein [Flavobacteriaceae bacterium CG02_land_8_20_14_3_00_34_13]PIX09044.1 MAG: rhodanese-like domain-containing protein [Flavobacteriaceae bacterium CG_4_8_14_3_um_filter_34_10]PIZ06908.1 MAG: rhodanese-like domain-con